MSETKTDYKEGDHSQFIEYLFSQEPKDKGAIQLESNASSRYFFSLSPI